MDTLENGATNPESETMIQQNNHVVQLNGGDNSDSNNTNNNAVPPSLVNNRHRPKKVRLFKKIVDFCGRQDDLDKKKDTRYMLCKEE